jgi:thiamine biosynthesis lipoprotein
MKRQQASPEVREVLAACDAVTEETFGAFDIAFAADVRVAARPGFGPIDPSGFVKGWALERAAAILEHHGTSNFAINAGGDVLTRGRPEPDRDWTIGIQHPIRGDATAATVSGTDLSVATSGRYERGDHIIDPRSAAPATRLLSASVVASDLGRADAYATAAMVLGDEAMDWLTTMPGIEAMIITPDRRVIKTEGFDRPTIAAVM